jgi:hypothetical protein
VAPFYKQVRLLRTVLREAGLRDVRVGSVEDYQVSARWKNDDIEELSNHF